MRYRFAPIAFDIGGVISARCTPEHDRVWESRDFLHIRTQEHAISVLRAVVAAYGPEQVHIISKARDEPKLWRWLDSNSVCTRTGIRVSHVHICRERAEKARLCAEHGIQTLVDNRLEVLHACRWVVPNLILFKGVDAAQRSDTMALTRARAVPIDNWHELGALLLRAV